MKCKERGSGKLVDIKKRTIKDWIVFILIASISAGGLLYYVYFLTPKNSLELYQALHFAEDFEEVKKLMLAGYAENFKEVDFEYIQNNSADHISQFTLFEYNGKSYVIMTSPGTKRLKVLGVEELPKNLRSFFLELER